MQGKKKKSFFKSELLALEAIKNEKGIEVENLMGSWAGAFGHTQFMPTTYLKFSAPLKVKKFQTYGIKKTLWMLFRLQLAI